jgi:urease accessory protein
MNALLLLILDSRSPAGAHNHSGGMEAAVTAGIVNDVDDVRAFCRGRLRTSGRVAAGFAATACRAWLDGADRWRELDAELTARMPSEAVRAASRTMGSGLRRLVRATVPDSDLAALGDRPHHALVLGAACALTGGSPQIAARAAALATCTAPASAAIRLLGLDPYAVHAVIAGLAPEIDAIEFSGLPADSAPALDLLADVHATQEVRLFAS